MEAKFSLLLQSQVAQGRQTSSRNRLNSQKRGQKRNCNKKQCFNASLFVVLVLQGWDSLQKIILLTPLDRTKLSRGLELKKCESSFNY